MALFTDGIISTLENLSGQDSGILEMAASEGIDVTSKLALAQDEVGLELTAWLVRTRVNPRLAWPGDPVFWGGQPTLGNIVVTTPLRLWHTLHTLVLVYRDAYQNQLNDRYLARWNEYKELARWASGMLFQTGAGVVWDPIPAAAAPALTTISGTLPGSTYYAAVAWLNARGEEGAPGTAASLTAPDQSALQVAPVNPPANARSWNVYVGDAPGAVTLQNRTPLGPDQVWIEPGTGLIAGRPPGAGQAPNSYRVIPRTLQRG